MRWRTHLLGLSLIGLPVPMHAQSPQVVRAAAADTALRVVVSTGQRRLWVIAQSDTLLAARVAVGSERSMTYGARQWTFHTPSGIHRVLAKEQDPIWIPPDWHYVEVARREHARIVWLHGDTSIDLHDGSRLIVKALSIRIEDDSTYDDAFEGSDILVGHTLYVPPAGSPARRVRGELGKYRLVLGNAIGIHGTKATETVGTAATHGCMRLYDSDIAWLYAHVPVGTKVYIY